MIESANSLKEQKLIGLQLNPQDVISNSDEDVTCDGHLYTRVCVCDYVSSFVYICLYLSVFAETEREFNAYGTWDEKHKNKTEKKLSELEIEKLVLAFSILELK